MIRMSNAQTIARLAELTARRMVLDAHACAKGLITVEAVARRSGYYQRKLEAAAPGAGSYLLRIAMAAVQEVLGKA